MFKNNLLPTASRAGDLYYHSEKILNSFKVTTNFLFYFINMSFLTNRLPSLFNS